MKHRNSQNGFSIIDMVMGLGIIAVAIIGIMSAQKNYIQMSSEVEVTLRGISLGNSVMNIIRMHRFDENASPPWVAILGTEAGESTSADYDDIDDYAGASWDFSGDGFAGYTIQTRVFNVNLASSWLDSVGPRTNYKRIIVSVNNSSLEEPIIFSSIYTGIVVDG